MTTRIKQLIEQCTNQKMDKPWPLVDTEMLAELIVKACGQFTVDIMLCGGIEPEHAYHLLMVHMGVSNE
jgi:hypothetical protein